MSIILLTDFADEIDVYLKAEQLIDTLRTWKSAKTSFIDRMNDLMNELITKNYFKAAEMVLVNAWIEDLAHINYNLPNNN